VGLVVLHAAGELAPKSWTVKPGDDGHAKGDYKMPRQRWIGRAAGAAEQVLKDELYGVAESEVAGEV
jgi:hypothetical protein